MKTMTKHAPAVALLASAASAALAEEAKPSAKDQEAKLIAVLKSADSSRKDKADACRELGVIGTKDAVAPLAALLGDEKHSHMARYGLEPNPDPSVDEALRAALGSVKGRPLVGIIGSIGVRRDAKAVDALSKLLKDSDADVARGAARSLGSIGTPEAVKALQDNFAAAPDANRLAFCEGLLRSAEGLCCAGKKDEAAAIYKVLDDPKLPAQVRCAATCGIKATQK